MKHTLTLFLFLSVTITFSTASESKIFFGGGIGASFGSVTAVSVSPFIGYKLFEKTNIGTGIKYQYYKNELYDVSTSLYGGSVFVEQFLTNSIFLHGEYELLSLETKYFDELELYQDQERFLHHGILVGAGYRHQMSNAGYLFILGMVNLNQTANSPYSMPIIKIGFSFN